MRKIAARAGVSPGSIYNYYPSKDALYLEVLKAGFEMLLASLRPAVDLERPTGTLNELVGRYLHFSREYPSYYDVMFSLPVPKYLDYVGTEMEEAAREEKDVAVANLRLAEEAIRAGVAKGEFRADLDPKAAALTVWAALHGLVSLHRSGVLAEVEVELEQALPVVMERLAAGLVKPSRE